MQAADPKERCVPVPNDSQTLRQTVVAVLRTVRMVATFAMLGVVLAGAFGYGGDLKLGLAAGGVALAVILKASHILA